ncbi:unannotated protein [freshwater metagenome]|uniref:Unannotated protein n=1 Tax=freshwater metagenome TaxID=449393 RepID=A0A6J6EJ69_9ZZZZ
MIGANTEGAIGNAGGGAIEPYVDIIEGRLRGIIEDDIVGSLDIIGGSGL